MVHGASSNGDVLGSKDASALFRFIDTNGSCGNAVPFIKSLL